MIHYTMQCLTMSGYMVDCPHLERMGYGGDGNSSTMTLQTMYSVAPTYLNWLSAWEDVMTRMVLCPMWHQLVAAVAALTGAVSS